MMKYILLVALLLLSGCPSQTTTVDTTGEMTGDPVSLYAPAYIEMCQRDPNSELCPQDVPETQSERKETGAMTGEAVNLRAKAYSDLCNREPESVLCN